MIKKIHIQNYKLFKSLSLKDLSKIFLIGGKNNSGKTSILEAVFFPLDCLNPGMFFRFLTWRGINSLDTASVFEHSYHNFDVSKPMIFEYTVNSSKKRLQYEFVPPSSQPLIHNGNIVELPKSSENNFGGIKISYGSDDEKRNDVVFLQSEPDRMTLINKKKRLENYNNIRASFVVANEFNPVEVDARRYGSLDKINKTDEILSSLQILEPKLKSLSIIPLGDKPTLYGDTGMGKKIPLRLMGQGTIRLLSVLLAISEVENGVVLVDELENGFHHSVLKLMWEVIATYAKKNNTQIIATTHSRELITGAVEGIPEDIRGDFKYMRIEREQEQFKTKMYDFETLDTALDFELEIR